MADRPAPVVQVREPVVTRDAVATTVDRNKRAKAADTIVVAQGPSPTSPADTPQQTVEARELATKLTTAAAALEKAGLHVDVRTAAEEAPVTTTRTLKQRDVAAALYGVEASQVTEAQLTALRAQNPQLDDDVPTGTAVAIAGTPTSLALARDHLALARLALADLPPSDASRAAVDARLVEVRGAAHQYTLARDIDGAKATADRLVREHRPDGVPVVYERVRRDIQRARDSDQMTPAQADTALAALAAAESQTQVAAARDASSSFVARRRTLAEAARTVVIGDDFGIIAAQNIAALNTHDASRPEAMARIERATTAALDRLAEMRRLAPNDAATIDAQIAAVRRSGQTAIADIDVVVGDHAAAERRLLPPALAAGDLLAPDRSERLDTEGVPRSSLGSLFTSTTTVGSLSDERRDAVASRIAALPEAERQRAIDGLLQLADVYTRADDGDRSRTSGQVLGALAARLNDQPLAVQAGILTAMHETRISNFDAARRALDDAETRARAITDTTTATNLQLQVVTARVATTRAAASSPDETVARAAADRLRDLRRSLETSGPLSRPQLARLALLEAQTFLGQHRADDAKRALTALDRYRDIPEAREASDAFRRDNTESGITAAIKVGLRASTSTSPGLAAGVTIGSGLAGAGVGFFFGGPVGAGLGFLAGSGIGGLGVSAYGVARHFDEVRQAFDTGLTSLSTVDALADGAFFGLTTAGALSPLGGVARLSALGLSRETVSRSLREAAALAGTNATAAEIERQTTQLLMREAAEGTLRFGGAPLSASAVGALVGPIAAQYVQIERMPAGPERDAARRRFQENLAQGALITGATIAASSLALRSLRGGQRWPADTRVGTAADPLAQPTTVRTLPIAEAQAQLDTLLAETGSLDMRSGPELDRHSAQLRGIRAALEAQPESAEIRERLTALSRLESRADATLTWRYDVDQLRLGAIRDELIAAQRELGDQRQRFEALGVRRGPNGTFAVDPNISAQALADALAEPARNDARGVTRTWGRTQTNLTERSLQSPEAQAINATIDAMEPQVRDIEAYRDAMTAAIRARQDAGQRITGTMSEIFHGEETRDVRYLSERQRATYEVVVRNGRLFDANGQPLTTRTASAHGLNDQDAIFVLSADGRLYVSDDHATGRFHHSSFTSGAPVQAAGQITVVDGRIVSMTDVSGHYRPSPVMQRQVIMYLRERGVAIDDVMYTETVTPGHRPVRDVFPRTQP